MSRCVNLRNLEGMKISEYGVEDEEGTVDDIRVGGTIFRTLRFAVHPACGA